MGSGGRRGDVCGIWATHFIAMLACDPGISIAYGLGRTALSLIAAVMVTLSGLALAIYDPARWSAPVGGALVGGGVAAMHYLGMSAVVLGGRIAWEPGLVVASILLGIAFGAGSLAIARRGDNTRSIIAAALLLTLAIVTHHFTAMGAVLLQPDPTQAADPLSVAPMSLAVGIAATAFAVLGMSLIGAIADRRMADRAGIGRGAHSAAIIRAVISLGRGLGRPVLAEGVETASQLAFLSEEACSEVQGYLFGRPAPISEYASAVRKAAPEEPAPMLFAAPVAV